MKSNITVDQVLFGNYKVKEGDFSMEMENIKVDNELVSLFDRLSNLKGKITDDRKIKFLNGDIAQFELFFDKGVCNMKHGRFVCFLNEGFLVNGSISIISGNVLYYNDLDENNVNNWGRIVYHLSKNVTFA